MGRSAAKLDDEHWLALGTEVAFLLGVSSKTITEWTKNEALPIGPNRKYRLRPVISWALDRAGGRTPEGVDAPLHTTSASIEARTVYNREQSRKLKIENERALGNLVTMEEALDVFRIMAQEVVDTMEGLPSMVDTDAKTRRRLEQAVSKARLDLIESLEQKISALDRGEIDIEPAADEARGSVG